MTKAALRRLHRTWATLEERSTTDDDVDPTIPSLATILDARRRQVVREAIDSALVMAPDGSVIVGLDVVIRDEGRLVRYSLVPPGDGISISSELAADSPLGKALIGGRPGDSVVVEAPAGPRVVEIVDVR
jgi:transcription elongation GreA/GreB family factor